MSNEQNEPDDDDRFTTRVLVLQFVTERLLAEFLARLPDLEAREMLADLSRACRQPFADMAQSRTASEHDRRLGAAGTEMTDGFVASVAETEAALRKAAAARPR